MAKSRAIVPRSALLASVPKRGRDEIARIMAEQGGGLTLVELLARNWDYETLLRTRVRELTRHPAPFRPRGTELKGSCPGRDSNEG